MSLAWICHTRPDVSCTVAQAAQITEALFDAEAVKQLNRTIKAVKSQLKGELDIEIWT